MKLFRQLLVRVDLQGQGYIEPKQQSLNSARAPNSPPPSPLARLSTALGLTLFTSQDLHQEWQKPLPLPSLYRRSKLFPSFTHQAGVLP